MKLKLHNNNNYTLSLPEVSQYALIVPGKHLTKYLLIFLTDANDLICATYCAISG